MNKCFISLILAVVTIFGLPLPSHAEVTDYTSPKKDSAQLQYQDILMLFLLPHIDEVVNRHYSHTLKELPVVYPYFVDVIQVKRVNGFRGFHFVITLEARPVVGPHIPVGKDRLVFEVAPTIPGGLVKLVEYKHLETYELPTHWQDIVK